jgi:hypothetical protein
MTSKKTAVAPAAQTTALTTNVDTSMMMADANIGREKMSVADMALPYFSLLQALSPQVKKSSPNRIDGAEEGDFFNTVTTELFSGEEGLTLLPCAFQKAYVEWTPRDSGGGFVASHEDDRILQVCERNEIGMDVRKDNGNLIVLTFYYYVMVLRPNGGHEFGIISMTRTGLKKARKWNSMLSSLQVQGPSGMFNPPMFAQVYHVTSIAESNNKGDFYNWNVQFKELVNSPEVYAVAKKFAESVRSGSVKAAPPVEEAEEHDTF